MNILKLSYLPRDFSVKNLNKMWHIIKNHFKKITEGLSEKYSYVSFLACYLASSASKKRFKSHTDCVVSQFILCASPGAPPSSMFYSIQQEFCLKNYNMQVLCGIFPILQHSQFVRTVYCFFKILLLFIS